MKELKRIRFLTTVAVIIGTRNTFFLLSSLGISFCHGFSRVSSFRQSTWIVTTSPRCNNQQRPSFPFKPRKSRLLHWPTTLSLKNIKESTDFDDDIVEHVKNIPKVMDQKSKFTIDDDESIPLKSTPKSSTSTIDGTDMSRRNFFRNVFVATIAVGIGSSTTTNSVEPKDSQKPKVNSTRKDDKMTATIDTTSTKTKSDEKRRPQKMIEPIDIEKVALENTINVTLLTIEEDMTQVETFIDRKAFNKVKKRKRNLWWIPPIFQPSPDEVKIPNSELLLAGIVAGSLTEILRTSLLYPLSTVKTRIQAQPYPVVQQPQELLSRKIEHISTAFQTQVERGELYAGVLPSLLISVPSSGVYCGIRDVTKRILLARALSTSTKWDDIVFSLAGAFVADVCSLAVRTPAVIFSTRRQAATGVDSHVVETNATEVTNDDLVEKDTAGATTAKVIAETKSWWEESVQKLPIIILTDLPYLLLRILFIRTLSQGNENIGQYELINLLVSCVCAFITTPFDVVRTRILVDSDGDASNGMDGGVIAALDDGFQLGDIWDVMKSIMKEGVHDDFVAGNNEMLSPYIGANSTNFVATTEGQVDVYKVQNLYAGWFERTLYFGLGVAWLDPIRVLGYLHIRDTVLLQWFE